MPCFLSDSSAELTVPGNGQDDLKNASTQRVDDVLRELPRSHLPADDRGVEACQEKPWARDNKFRRIIVKAKKDDGEDHEKGRARQYLKWRESLNADPAWDHFSKREEAIAFAAFLAGWWLRTGENPSEFWNPKPTQNQ